jgi:hypothetical protein
MSESWGSELSLSIEEKKQRVALSIQRCGRAPLKTLSWLCSDALDNDILRFNLMHEWLSQSTNLSKTSKAFQKFDFEEQLLWWLTLTLDILKVSMKGASFMVHVHQLDWIQSLSKRIDKKKLLALQDKLNTVIHQVNTAKGNYNQSLLIETALISWKSMLK